MGEIADDMIDGSSCELCGQYFVDPKDKDKLYTHGYPVTCWDCWKGLSKKEKKDRQRALTETL